MIGENPRSSFRPDYSHRCLCAVVDNSPSAPPRSDEKLAAFHDLLVVEPDVEIAADAVDMRL